MKRKPFPFPMRKYERILGIAYIPVHAVFLAYLLTFILDIFDFSLTPPQFGLLRYAVSALFVLIALYRYCKNEIGAVARAVFRGLQAVILGYAFYFAADIAMGYILRALTDGAASPVRRDEAGMMIFVAVVLAPIVEETLFRGALFGTLRTKSRVLAYAVSTLVFALYHIWPYAIGARDASILIYALQYVPMSFALAWCYEYSNNICAPAVLHAVMNLVSAIVIQWRV